MAQKRKTMKMMLDCYIMRSRGKKREGNDFLLVSRFQIALQWIYSTYTTTPPVVRSTRPQNSSQHCTPGSCYQSAKAGESHRHMSAILHWNLSQCLTKSSPALCSSQKVILRFCKTSWKTVHYFLGNSLVKSTHQLSIQAVKKTNLFFDLPWDASLTHWLFRNALANTNKIMRES